MMMNEGVESLSFVCCRETPPDTRGVLKLGYDGSLEHPLKRIVTHPVASQTLRAWSVWTPELMTASACSKNAVVSVTSTPRFSPLRRGWFPETGEVLSWLASGYACRRRQPACMFRSLTCFVHLRPASGMVNFSLSVVDIDWWNHDVSIIGKLNDCISSYGDFEISKHISNHLQQVNQSSCHRRSRWPECALVAKIKDRWSVFKRRVENASGNRMRSRIRVGTDVIEIGL